MIKYVMAFIFNKERTKVLLIHKKHGPSILIDKLNGIGGKIEEPETPEIAIIREVREESSLVINPKDFNFVFQYSHVSHNIYCFSAFIDFKGYKTTTDEEVVEYWIDSIFDKDCPIMSNLRWMIPLCLDTEINTAFIEGKRK